MCIAKLKKRRRAGTASRSGNICQIFALEFVPLETGTESKHIEENSANDRERKIGCQGENTYLSVRSRKTKTAIKSMSVIIPIESVKRPTKKLIIVWHSHNFTLAFRSIIASRCRAIWAIHPLPLCHANPYSFLWLAGRLSAIMIFHSAAVKLKARIIH